MRKCKVCKKEFKPKYSTVQPTCDYPCALILSKKLDEKKKKDQKKEHNKWKKKEQEKLKTISVHVKELQPIFNEFIRLRDSNQLCISCQNPPKKKNAGHYYNANNHWNVRFNEDLIGASPIEDLDFYSRASAHFKFALAPAAHALHNVSPVSRDGLRRSFEKKTSGFCYIFSMYIAKTWVNRIAFLWRNVGIVIDAMVAVFVYRTSDPLAGVFLAWYKAFFKRIYV